MTTSKLTIREINARAVLAPLKRPVRTAVGTIPSAPLVLIDVATEQGSSGRSYIFGYTPAALAPLVRLIYEIAPELKGKPVAPVERMREFDRRFRTRRMAGSDRYGGLWPRHPADRCCSRQSPRAAGGLRNRSRRRGCALAAQDYQLFADELRK